jgi:hypothetical protein
VLRETQPDVAAVPPPWPSAGTATHRVLSAARRFNAAAQPSIRA